jgi:plasmid stabilization system protein ParE
MAGARSADLRAIHAWLSELENAQPDRAIQRIHAAANMLVRLGDIGRPSRAEGQRELSVPGAPYVIAYRVEEDVYDIIAVYHTSQQR